MNPKMKEFKEMLQVIQGINLDEAEVEEYRTSYIRGCRKYDTIEIKYGSNNTRISISFSRDVEETDAN